MSSPPATPNVRLLRTSNPTPPEREDYKKQKVAMSIPNKPSIDIDTEQQFLMTDIQIPQQVAISTEDIQKIADAVKATMLNDIAQIIHEKTAPLLAKIENLEKENTRLKNDLDALEQYGRRSLIRISGIAENPDEGDTTPKIRKLISDIDQEYDESDVIRSHRVGKLDAQAIAESKPRQIIVRLSDPKIKFRILKCGKNLKKIPGHNKVYINEDLTITRSKICYHARQLLKREQISNLWTTNGKILLKDKEGTVHNVSRKEDFLFVARQVDPHFVPPINF